MNVKNLVCLVISLLLGSSCILAEPASTTVTTTTADGVTIYGELYFGDLDASSPMILLFHQGGSNGRGEYADIARWLNEAGYRAIAWDQRAGGATYGEANRTVAGLAAGVPTGFCDAYPDLQAALDYVMAEGLADDVFLWGSSYSAALVFRLAAENPGKVAGLLAFSPASGGPMEHCRARMWMDDVTSPVYVFRPASEMERASSIEQGEILTAAGARLLVVENGVHGSSMLLDARTNHDMQAVRESVIEWLGAQGPRQGAIPEYIREDWALRTQGTGIWIADNAAFKSDNEPFDAYGLQWAYGIGNMHLTGRLFGLIDGEEAGVFWQFTEFWDPATSMHRVLQIGGNGTVGQGKIWREADGSIKEEQTFAPPGGKPFVTGHRTWMENGNQHVQSYNIANGVWEENRFYIWTLEGSGNLNNH